MLFNSFVYFLSERPVEGRPESPDQPDRQPVRRHDLQGGLGRFRTKRTQGNFKWQGVVIWVKEEVFTTSL
jgi:hypothetical protein